MAIKKYGFKLDEIKPEDYIFGGGKIPTEILQSDSDWTSYLPEKEYQNLNNIEPYACVTFTVLNCVEILIKRQYGEDKNYSDRFLAAISGTKEGGNSPQIVCEFLRKIGVVPQDLWPFDSSINTFEKFYSPIPPKLYELAKEFNEEWDFRHEYVPTNKESISAAIQSSPLLVSVPAWNERNGKYYRPDGVPDNHATTMVYERLGDFRRIFDSYADGAGDPAIKDIEWEMMPTVIKRFWIKKRKDVQIEQLNLLWQILNKMSLWIAELFKQKEPIIQVSEPLIEPSVVLPLSLPTPPVLSKYLWDTKEQARHSSRVIMDEYFLSWKEKNLLCACIQQESGFNPLAIGKPNKNGTRDWGLAQFNDGKNEKGIPYWIGKGAAFESTEEVLKNPEKNVRIMIEQYKAGNLKYWVSFSSGAYKKYLI